MTRIDFAAVVFSLREYGLHPDEIGKAAGVSGQQVRFYQQGQQPRHSIGELLIELWCMWFKKTLAELPITSGPSVESFG